MKTKAFLAQIGLLIASAVFVSSSLAGPATLRPDSIGVEPHISRHGELAPFANRYGWKQAARNGRCTGDGTYVTPQRGETYIHHCRDYAGTDGITRRVLFNDGKGNGAAQRIYELHKDSSRLVVTFQDAVVIADSTGTVSPGSTPPPAVAGRQPTPEEALRSIFGTLIKGK